MQFSKSLKKYIKNNLKDNNYKLSSQNTFAKVKVWHKLEFIKAKLNMVPLFNIDGM